MTKVAIVTGAGSGIGLALARALGERGCSTVLVGRRVANLEQTAEQVRQTGCDVLVRAADVRDFAAINAIVDETVERYGRLDYLFNNAGIGMAQEVEDLTPEHWDRIIDINLMGVAHGVMAAYPVMMRQGFGHIVNVSSSSGLMPSPFMTPYAATKHGVVGLSLGLRPEAAVHGVRVSVVCPGFVDTPILDGQSEGDLRPSRFADVVDFRQMAQKMGPLYSPDLLASQILTQMDKNKALIVAPRAIYVAWLLHRLLPRVSNTLYTKFAARARGELQRLANTREVAASGEGVA